MPQWGFTVCYIPSTEYLRDLLNISLYFYVSKRRGIEKRMIKVFFLA